VPAAAHSLRPRAAIDSARRHADRAACDLRNPDGPRHDPAPTRRAGRRRASGFASSRYPHPPSRTSRGDRGWRASVHGIRPCVGGFVGDPPLNTLSYPPGGAQPRSSSVDLTTRSRPCPVLPVGPQSGEHTRCQPSSKRVPRRVIVYRRGTANRNSRNMTIRRFLVENETVHTEDFDQGDLSRV
jgi:hypothetical protein